MKERFSDRLFLLAKKYPTTTLFFLRSNFMFFSELLHYELQNPVDLNKLKFKIISDYLFEVVHRDRLGNFSWVGQNMIMSIEKEIESCGDDIHDRLVLLAEGCLLMSEGHLEIAKSTASFDVPEVYNDSDLKINSQALTELLEYASRVKNEILISNGFVSAPLLCQIEINFNALNSHISIAVLYKN